MYKKWNLFIILALLLGLVVPGPRQTVLAVTADLTIEPSSLPDAMITVNFQLLLIARYSGGSECTGCLWYTTLGDLPEGVHLNGDTGELLGAPKTVGTYTFTVVVDDRNGMIGSQAYTWNVNQVKTIVDVGTSSTYVGNTVPTTLGANARHPDPTYWPRPTGKMSFSVNYIPVPGCSGTEAISTNEWGQAFCTNYIPTGLSAGSYQIHVDFTPDEVSGVLYLSGFGDGTLQINSLPPAQVSGLLFNDDDHDGVKDSDESPRTFWEVYLDQGCNSSTDESTYTDSYTGGFTFTGLTIGDTYCLSVRQPLGFVITANPGQFTLDQQKYFEIGIYENWLGFSPKPIPVARTGEFYDQTIIVVGGTPPYTVNATIVAPLPAGLIFDKDTLRVYGTPTAAGLGEISLEATDSIGSYGEDSYQIIVQAEGTFDLTSSVNPSGLETPVTFTFSGSGDVVDHSSNMIIPPYGWVAFYDGDALIEGCDQTILNVNMDTYDIGDYPATCTTSALTEGQHTITASFSYPYGLYLDATRTLTQQVGAVSSLAISPDTLAIAAYQTPYSQQLSASGGTEPYNFSLLSGFLPNGLTLDGYGLLSGFADYPTAPGTYSITVQVMDANGAIASRDYEFVLDKGIPTVTASTSAEIFWNYPFNLSAEVLKKIPDGTSYVLVGTVAFFIDGNPVPGCGAVPEANSYYQCSNVSMDLAVGTHTVRAEYTPTGLYADYYYTAGSDSSEFTVQPMNYVVQGSLFEDDDQNGVNEDEDRLFKDGWTINLDENCDGGVDYTTNTSWGGFSFYDVPSSGQRYCLTVIGEPGYTQTTQQNDLDFVLTESKWVPIGFYYPTITLSPSEFELPVGSVGVEYNQVFSASGGTGPYTFMVQENIFSSLPEGLTISSDGVLSGTPINTGTYYLTVQAEDANHATGLRNYSLAIKTDGIFSLTSSSNPSIPGEEVTFTVSASSEGSYPPMGAVTFYADGTPIESCSNMPLNLLLDENGYPLEMGDYPVICTTTALETGTHEITAIYTDWTGIFNEPTLALTQEVRVTVSADLSIDNADSKDPVKPGSKLLYALTVSNLGTDLAESVIVSDKLDVNTTYLSVSAPRGWTCSYAENSGTVTCTSDSLKSSSSAIIKITVMVNKTAKVGKELVNNAFVSSTTFDPDLSNNAVVQKTLVAK